MALQVQTLERLFRYNSVDLIDPGAQYSAEQVRDFYAATYPEIVSAAVEGPEEKDGKLVYTFRKAVGTKGAREPRALKLQVKPGGAWKDIAEFEPERIAAVEQAVVDLARLLTGDVDVDWRIIEAGGRSPKVMAYCDGGKFQWRAR